MATSAITRQGISGRNEDFPHKVRLTFAALLAATFVIGLGLYGFEYYRLDLGERVESPLHSQLRPSGTIGLRLGILGVFLFGIIFLYPLRKRWRWLASIGRTKHWLDFHSLLGITAPILITYHASFKLEGLAGISYWIMIAVAVSGFVGRYLYTMIPRSLHSAELTISELDTENTLVSDQLAGQSVFREEDFARLLEVPSPDQVRRMSLVSVLWQILRLDLRRPFIVSSLRRRTLSAGERVATLGGFLKSGHRDLELVIANVRRQAGLRVKIVFLDRVRQMFHLWHVIHRPFSISFVALVLVHIGVVVMLGYF